MHISMLMSIMQCHADVNIFFILLYISALTVDLSPKIVKLLETGLGGSALQYYVEKR